MARFWTAPVMSAAACLALAACSAAEAADSEAPETETAQPARSGETKGSASGAGERAALTLDGEFTQGGFIRGQAPAPTGWTVTLNDQPLTVSEDGSFFAAFDRDADGEAVLEARSDTGEALTKQINVSARQWQISRVNVPKRSGGSSEAWWKKRKPEWEAITAARAKVTDAAGWRQDFIWPVKGRISGLFGRQRIYQGEPGSYHSGIDIAPGNGVPYVAPADGVVVLARTGFSLEGGLIIIDHGGGLNSAFLHSSKILVEEGDAVKQGQTIGHVGSTGRSTGPHLHWSLKWNDARLDPLLFTGPMNR